MTKTPWIAGAALAAMIGTAALAAAPDAPRHAPKTRADVQAKIAGHFKKADANGDGFVTKAEADAARDAMKAQFAERREQRRDERFAKLDTDRNGTLSKEEFSARPPRGDGKDGERRAMHRGHGGKHGMHHRGGFGGFGGFGGGNWFERADTNKDGKVSLPEASAGALARFDRMDSDRNGTISPEEHKAARDAMRAKWQERRAGKEG